MPFYHKNTQRDHTQQPARRTENKTMETRLNHDRLQEVSMWGTVQKRLMCLCKKHYCSPAVGDHSMGRGAHWEGWAEQTNSKLYRQPSNSSGDTSRKLNSVFQTHLWSQSSLSVVGRHLTQIKTLNTKKKISSSFTKQTELLTIRAQQLIRLVLFLLRNFTKTKRKHN